MFNITKKSGSVYGNAAPLGASSLGFPRARSDPCSEGCAASVDRPVCGAAFWVLGLPIQKRKGVSVMVKNEKARMWPGIKKAEPREIEPPTAAPGPVEQELDAVFVDDTEPGGGLQTGAGGRPVIRSEKHDLGLDTVDGWVAGIPVVGGVGESTVSVKNGVQVRMAVVVGENRAQVEWLKSRLFGRVEVKDGETA